MIINDVDLLNGGQPEKGKPPEMNVETIEQSLLVVRPELLVPNDAVNEEDDQIGTDGRKDEGNDFWNSVFHKSAKKVWNLIAWDVHLNNYFLSNV